MCLSVPGDIVSIDGDSADVNFGGIARRVSLMLCPDVKVGDYVLVHVGFVIQKVDKEEALETLRLFEVFKNSQHE
jgi:hydrogenase expression/formation protein HypC